MSEKAKTRGPLHGVRILDLSNVISGPLATMILGDQGADVIKVESPGLGDPLRGFGAHRGGTTSSFITTNRSKRSIVLDIHKESAKEIVRKMVAWADVLVENFRPGVMEKLGFDYDACRAINEDIIYVDISGFGGHGPHSDRRVYDHVIQAVSGMPYVQADPETGRPELVRTLMFDKATAYTASQAITAALFARERGQGGQRVTLAMLDVALAFLWPDGMMSQTFLGEGAMQPPPFGKVYSLYETADGFITFGGLQDVEWHGICRAADCEELIDDPRFKTIFDRMAHLDPIRDILSEIVVKHSTDHWCKKFEEHDVPHAPVMEPDKVHEHPQTVANASLEVSEHPAGGRFRQPLPAPKFAQTPAAPRRHAPGHGEHTASVLAEFGYSPEQIASLKTEGALG